MMRARNANRQRQIREDPRDERVVIVPLLPGGMFVMQ